MAKRDPNKTARNRIIKTIQNELRQLLPLVLSEVNVRDEASLNAKIGSKTNEFLDLKNEVINSDSEFTIKWLSGLKQAIDKGEGEHYEWIRDSSKRSLNFKKYLLLFLKRNYLKNFDALSKNRPKEEDSEIWIGENNADYGLLVTPRFNGSQWENDKSKIRNFNHGYWTVGHVLETGLVIPGRNEVITFKKVEEYLNFFKNVLVRKSSSKYEYEIAGLYCDYVNKSDNPLSIPLMIPEYRYLGLKGKHIHRLDIMVINPFTLNKIGFELSPFSTHGALKKIGGLTQKKINEMAAENFSEEMKKHRDYFNKYNVYTLIFPDDELKDCNNIFKKNIVPLLNPEKEGTELSFMIMEEYLNIT